MRSIECDCPRGSSEHAKDCESECLYCGVMIPSNDAELVPSCDDDDEWTRLAEVHGDDCEWIKTRAHRRPCSLSGD